MRTDGVEPLIVVQERLSCLCSTLLADNLRMAFFREFFFPFYCVTKKFTDIDKNRSEKNTSLL